MYDKITKTEFDLEKSKPRSQFFRALLELEVEEVLKIEKVLWTQRALPATAAWNFAKDLKMRGIEREFSGTKLKDGTGWYILRVK